MASVVGVRGRNPMALPRALRSASAARRRRIRVALVGLGAIGTAFAEECLRDDRFNVVAAVDPAKEGERVGTLRVRSNIEAVPRIRADVAVVATSSSLRAAADEFEAAMRRGFDVLTTCEELAFPWLAEPTLATHLDRVAKSRGVRLLSCGVNPGFLMDALPVMLSGGCVGARSITVTRLVDLTRRRPQLARKMGTGLDEARWRGLAAIGELGHRGLIESAYLCALGAGWPVESVEFDRSPIIHDGKVIGVHEVVDLRSSEDRSVRLELQFEAGGHDIDSINIDGRPPLRLVFQGGVQGDDATVARLVGCALSIRALPAGLRLPIEVSPWAWPTGHSVSTRRSDR